ncbi:MAG: imidazole glycerol phosphate synthase subunit HisH [Flavobacteriales bacterium]|nr:imidazole glycerol phosphate synthase subunit HisH [Flavobacteriales bacterium]
MLEGYPFSMGEPFFHEELKHLVGHFEEIVLITKHSDQPALFEVPTGVRLLTLKHTEITTISKLYILVRQFIVTLFSETRRDLRILGSPLNLLTFKTALAYKEHAHRVGQELLATLNSIGDDPANYVWYTYWNIGEAYMLAEWKRQGIIEFFYTRVHGADLYAERHPFNYLPFRNKIFQHANCICCISEHGRRYLWERYPRYSHRFALHRLGVAEQNPIPFQGNTPKKILSLSGIVPVKNLETLIRALALWRGPVLEWHHVGAGGDVAYESDVKKMAAELLDGMPNLKVHFHGFLPLHEVMERIQVVAPDVLINVSHYEGIPVSMMECAAFGIPIIGPNVGGVPEIVIDGRNGFIIKDNSPEGVHALIDRFFALEENEVVAMRASSKIIQETCFNATDNYEKFARLLSGKDAEDPIMKRGDADRPTVGIIQTGLGNVAAVQNMLHSAGIRSEAVADPRLISRYSSIILPGVGAFDEGMKRLDAAGFSEAIHRYVVCGGQLIGICLGMQLLFDRSEEGTSNGLGLIKGNVVRFPSKDGLGRPLNVPHMGWNMVEAGPQGTNTFWKQPMRFYFTHSFHAKPTDASTVLLTSHYGVPFVSAVRQGNVWGFQFHPEKSHHFGKELFTQLIVTEPKASLQDA